MAIYFVFMAVSIVLAFGYVFYLRRRRAQVVLSVHLPARAGRRQLRAVHAVAAGAVPDRLSRERGRFHQLGWPLRRRGDGVSRGLGHPVVRQPGRFPWPITAIAFVFGLMLVPMSEETRGRSLPRDW